MRPPETPSWTPRPGRTYRFPPDFLWGAATSSHQVEGHNSANDWWAYEQSGRLPCRSGAACRHYSLYESDFERAERWGHNAHRFSVEWSRVEPEPGRWQDRALDHYRRVVDDLRRREIEPVVTLHHFTNPAWFARRGGWLRRDAPDLFARYARRIVGALDGVRFWITINEPTVYAKKSFLTGEWPPMNRGGWWKAATVLRRLGGAHRAAYRSIRRRRPGARVGLAHSAPWVEPCDPDRPMDRTAARIRDFLLNDFFFRLAGLAGPGSHDRPRWLDYLGINYYARTVVRWRARGMSALAGEECREDHHGTRRRFADTGWEVYPAGLLAVLLKFSNLGVPLMVTENGVATRDEALRRDYLLEHVAAVGEALEQGADVIGYLYWSLIDNYEWTLGRQARFGLAAVDFDTQRRTPRPAAAEFARVCTRNEVRLAGSRARGPAGSDGRGATGDHR